MISSLTSTEIEQAVIGCLLDDPALVAPELGRLLRPEHFGDGSCRTIYAAALALWHERHALDLLLLTAALEAQGQLVAVGGAACVTACATAVCGHVLAPYYAEEIRTRAALRQIADTCRAVAGLAVAPGADAAVLAGRLAALLSDLTAERPRAALTMVENVEVAIERYEAASQRRGGRMPGVYGTGLDDLDDHLAGGFHPGDLLVLAAETSGGKTALAVQMASAVAGKKGRVLVGSYEMTTAQITDRLMSHASQVPAGVLRHGLFSEHQLVRLGAAVPQVGW